MTCFSNYISKFPFCKWNQIFVFFAKVMALVKVRHINQKEIPIFKNTTYIELKKKNTCAVLRHSVKWTMQRNKGKQ